MANKRMVTTKIWQDEWFGELSFFDQTLWIGLFSACADDQGRLLDNPTLIRACIFPYKDISIDTINESLDKFSDSDKLVRYIAGGKELIQLLQWWKHQKSQWANPSEYKEPDGWIDRIRTRLGNTYYECNWKTEDLQKAIDNLVSQGGNTRYIPNLIGHVPVPVPVPVPVTVNKDSSPKNGEKPQSRAKSEKDVKRGELEDYFSEISKLKKPECNTEKQKKAAGTTWWGPLRDILTLVDWDVGAAKRLVSDALGHMRDNKLTVSSPQSILNVAKSIQAEKQYAGGGKRVAVEV